MDQAGCLERGQIAAYMLGEVDDQQMEDATSHLAVCPRCQAVADEMESESDELIELLERPEPDTDYSNEHECQEAVAKAKAFARTGPTSSAASDQSISEDEFSLPTRLGEYLILNRVGGHMGAVYEARHTKMDRTVAVKLLPKGALANDQAMARFQREIKAVGRLEHPNIVRAYDAREIDGRHVLVMEYVDGLNLSDLVRSRGPLTVADACEAVRQAATGLQYVHEQGLVHRDVKPSNLMLTRDGQVKVLDLGLARFRAHQPGAKEVTGPGHAVGTANYIAPEQITRSHEVDTRADVYGLGCTLYKLLCGRAPFDRPEYEETRDVITAHVQEPVPPLRELRNDIPERLVAVLERMLAKDPNDRFDTPGQVAVALEPFTPGADLRALASGRPPGETIAGTRTPEPSSWTWKALAAVAVVVLLVVGTKMALEKSGSFHKDSGSDAVAERGEQEGEKRRQGDGVTPSTDEGGQAEQESPESSEDAQPEEANEGHGTGVGDDGGGSKEEPAGRSPGAGPGQSPREDNDWLASSRNEQPAFVVRVDVDHPDRVYRGGELMRVKVASSRAGYLHLIYQSAGGKLKCLFPNPVQKDNKIPAGKEIVVPDENADFDLEVGPPYGKEVLKAVVTLMPMEPSEFGVESLTGADATPLQPAVLKDLFVRLREKPTLWAEHQVQVETVPADKSLESLKPRRVGLFVGVGRYQDPGIRGLGASRNDAVRLCEVMQEHGRLDEALLLTDEDAGLAAIRTAVCKTLVEHTRPGDEVFLYFSGLGARCADDNGDEPDQYDECLVPFDGRCEDPATIRNTMLVDDTLARWLQDLDGRRIVVIVETCCSVGPSLYDKRPGQPSPIPAWPFDFLEGDLARTKDVGQTEIALLAAARANQVAFVRRQGELSAMTNLLSHLLADGSQPITLTQAFEYLKVNLPAYLKEQFPGANQTPVLVDHTTPPLYLRP